MFQQQNPDTLNPVAWKVNRAANPYAMTTVDILYPTLKNQLLTAEQRHREEMMIARAAHARTFKERMLGMAPGSSVPKGPNAFSGNQQPVVVNVGGVGSGVSNSPSVALEAERLRLKEKELELKVEQERASRDNKFIAAMQAIAASNRVVAAAPATTTVSTSSASSSSGQLAPGIPALSPFLLRNGQVYPPTYFQPAYVHPGGPALTPSDASQPSDNGVFGELKL
jgi:hypothetical protein